MVTSLLSENEILDAGPWALSSVESRVGFLRVFYYSHLQNFWKSPFYKGGVQKAGETI